MTGFSRAYHMNLLFDNACSKICAVACNCTELSMIKGRFKERAVGTCICICTLLAYCKASDFVQALGVLAAEVVGAAIASAIVGGITANVPSKKQLKA